MNELVGRARDEVAAPGKTDDGVGEHRRRRLGVVGERVDRELLVDAGRGEGLAGLLRTQRKGEGQPPPADTGGAREKGWPHKLLELGLLARP